MTTARAQSVYVAQAGATPSCVDVDGAPGCDAARNPQLSADGRLLSYEAFDAAAGVQRVRARPRDRSRRGGRRRRAVVRRPGRGARGGAHERRRGRNRRGRADRVTLLAKFVDPADRHERRGAHRERTDRRLRQERRRSTGRTPDRLDASADANGDGRADRGVLATLDLESGALRVLGPATQAAVGGRTIAFIDPAGHVFVDSASGRVGPLTLARQLRRSRPRWPPPTRPCASSRPAPERSPARRRAALRSSTSASQAMGSRSKATWSPLLSRAAQPAHPVRAERRERRARSRTSPACGASAWPATATWPRTSASPTSASQLNGDGDLDDCLALIVAPNGTLFDTSDPARGTPRHTIVPCTGDVCDDTDPFKIFPFGEHGELAKLRHLSVESQEPALFADLNQRRRQRGRGRARVRGRRGRGVPADRRARRQQRQRARGHRDGPGPEPGRARRFPRRSASATRTATALSDGQIACQSDADCIAQGVCGGSPCCVDIQARTLALADSDGDGVFDVYDICPTVFDPTQDPTDVDRDGTPDTCDELISRCGDGVVRGAASTATTPT